MHSKTLLLLLFVILCDPIQASDASSMASDLQSCLSSAQVHNFSFSSSSPSFSHLLNISIQNLRFTDPSIPKPLAIILPSTKSQIQSSILCCRRAGVSIRIRSGGHSYEGQSSISSSLPFAIIDLMNLNAIHFDSSSNTSWVEAGATVGELYLTISTLSNGSLAISAGSCATMGTGGHIAGGGFGFLSRKYGLAADSVVDALLIDHEGKVFDKRSMGSDVFWAIRGGGGGSWGVVYAWKLKAVPVPKRVTRFSFSRRATARDAALLLHKWQTTAPSLPDEFYISTLVSGDINGTLTTISISFSGLFIGSESAVRAILTSRFPELELNDSDCVEVSWLDSAAHYAGFDSPGRLSDRSQPKVYYKAKSDYVKAPISKRDLERVLNKLAGVSRAYLILDPYGGAMSRISESDLPFPHRAGNLFSIQYRIEWTAEDERSGGGEKYIEDLRDFYEFMAPFVSKEPRGAYVNYLDLDLGLSVGRVEEDRVWGNRYFLGNFDRLVKAKTLIDPQNVFNNEQSIPPLSY
ncbi:putative berberine/berberine, FAD-binding domain, PCMH-type, FAD-binding, type PCMH, subdomain 1 [Dioscorea sansibarensis]